MASKKDYFCKDCGNNNNGWCPILKRNGLKDIETCNYKKSKINMIVMPGANYEEEDILVQAAKEKHQENKNDSLLEEVKTKLWLDISEEKSVYPGKKRITISLKYEDEVISDIDFDVKL